ncbi:hypothetical protein ABBQ32_012835 [Trebouxia sp. C0010 RCD-2024]
MYNADGSLKTVGKNRYKGGNSGGGFTTLGYAPQSQYDSKENQKRPGTPSESEGRPAAGMKSKVEENVGHRSRAANEEAQLRNQRGSDIFAEPDALQTREVNRRKLQDIKGSDIFSDDASGTGHAAGAVPGLSDTKKKSLYNTSVFNEDGPAAAPQVSELKKNEMSGSIVFGSSTSEQPRSAIGGVRKPPGGGSSLSFGDNPPKSTTGDTSSGRKTPGGQSSFSFGW